VKRPLAWAALVGMTAVLCALAVMTAGAPPSIASTYDTGPNGYRALFETLRRVGTPVGRFEQPLADLPRGTGVLAATAPIVYDAADRTRLVRFMRRGGTVLAFGKLAIAHAPHLIVLDVRSYANAALARDPRGAVRVYRLLAGRGPVLFDERLHGYDRSRSLWQVLPRNVHFAVGLAALALLLMLVDQNVRFMPPLALERPEDRTSAEYLRSMGGLLRRARAGRLALERFGDRSSPPSDAAVLAAATRYIQARKDRP
jgi:hypothetical protein